MNASIKILGASTALRGGSVETVKNRKGEIIGYQGRLPRSLSRAPKTCKNPSKFRQRVGGLQSSWTQAAEIVNAAIDEIKSLGSTVKGRTFADYTALDLERRYAASRRRVDHHGAANKRIGSWRNIAKNWLPKAKFWEWPPSAITHRDCQAFVDWLANNARKKDGAPLSTGMVHNIAQHMKAVLKLTDIHPNPASEIRLPALDEPSVEFMTFEQQCRFFSCKEIPIKDRIRAGVGMGLGLRVGELLALEAEQITFTDDGRGFAIIEFGGDNHSPIKGKGGNKKRRVELFEPGLGFLKLWMRDHYEGGIRVFEARNGGFDHHWAERFPDWSEHAGRDLTSHIMRHSYAVSMLSGFWGYPKKSLEFVQHQMGHSEISTTEKYYAKYADGTWARDVAEMVGDLVPEAKREIATAAFLLGLGGLLSGPSGGSGSGKKPDETGDSAENGDSRWSTRSFPGKPGENADKAACNRPLCQPATPVAFPGRNFAPRRRRRGIA